MVSRSLACPRCARMEEPKSMSMTGLVDAFVRIDQQMKNRSFAFLLGAGASRSSGIKIGSDMVQDWLLHLYRAHESYLPPDTRNSVVAEQIERVRALAWASDDSLGITGFDRNQPGASYPDIYWKMFSEHPDE